MTMRGAVLADEKNGWRHVLIMLACAAFVSTVFGCSDLFPVQRIEAGRVSSPDRRVDAVILRTRGGATTGTSYQVHVAPRGEQPEIELKILTADHVAPGELRVGWTSDRMLRISAGDSRIFQFKNFWMSREVDDFGYVVHVRLEQAPGGAPDWVPLPGR